MDPFNVPFFHASDHYGAHDDPWWMTALKILLWMVVSVILVPPVWRLCGRAGFPRWFSLAMVVPLANIALLYFLAFSLWPSDLRGKSAAPGGPGAPGRAGRAHRGRAATVTTAGQFPRPPL
jgi:hypothetical protein